ncbi:armadillo-type protein [Microdochium trichocladiopsis]|uniref:Armadillo-type protein n=1 Tax=Microdochium trichocladiopsis TaxID=1682393 RepID=A0A9P8Y267_9PEZI|nr:armadillo-type protein [Microdochium trichocladiopsis]KAH7027842.1 armadillo-type protein [Microdochium trichocladiopsis]
MADAEPDYSSLPLTERWTHKVWKVRKGAYEEAAKQFEVTPDEYDPAFRPFNQDPGLWKGAVADSNVAAQADGIAAYCAFLKFGGKENTVRSRHQVIAPIVEKGLVSTRPGTKASSIEALLLLVEVDASAPVIEDILPAMSAKQPKVVAAALAALTTIFHGYGCKLCDPKPVLKILPKAFGHADKNVRAEATNLAVEFYRWLREAMKPMFWGDLKPTQQTDLEAQFEKIKAEPPPKQERLLRSQQEAMARAPAGGDDEDMYDDQGDVDEPAEVDAFDLAEPQDVLSKVPASFHDNLASSKWKDRKEALEALYALLNVPRIKDGDFNEINRGLAKCMKDANIAVVTQAAQCIEVLAQGLRKAYGRYRTTVMAPIMERLKEKKASVSDALGAALDQVFLATSLSECLEDITTFLIHKNPQVKESTMKFLVRCLRTTRDVPSKPEIATIVEAGKKLLAESSEGLRSGGAEVLGTIMKIIGERAMNPHMEGLDDIRKNKIKEFYDKAEVKAKDKPKAPPPAATRAPPGGPKKIVGGAKKPASAAGKKPVPRTAAPPPEPEPAPPQPAARPGVGSKLGMPKSSGISSLKAPGRRIAAPGVASPRRAPAAPPPPDPIEDDEPFAASPPPKPRLGLGRGGLAGRSLAKPAMPAAPAAEPSPPPVSGLSALERGELEELRAAQDRLLKQVDELRQDKSRLSSEIQELKNHNASLIEDHTRDVLSIKAKETQLVRARSDAEAAEQVNDRLRRELERLKRALSKAEGLGVSGGMTSPGIASPTPDEAAMFRDSSHYGGSGMSRTSYNSTMSEDKENGDIAHSYARNKALSPDLRYGSGSSGRGSPARSSRPTAPTDEERHIPGTSGANGNGVESWKRAAEVTSQLKARIEQMKVSYIVVLHHLKTSSITNAALHKGQTRLQSAIALVDPVTNFYISRWKVSCLIGCIGKALRQIPNLIQHAFCEGVLRKD